MPNIVFEHLKEHINLISLRENKAWPFNIDLMSTRLKILKSLELQSISIRAIRSNRRQKIVSVK